MLRSYPVFLLGLFVQATLLQTASNRYITILGLIEAAAKRISIVGICNKIACIIRESHTSRVRLQLIQKAVSLKGSVRLSGDALTIDLIIAAALSFPMPCWSAAPCVLCANDPEGTPS